MCFGTFDILHEGHKDYFKQAKEEGDILIVVLARDNHVLQYKKSLWHDEEIRLNEVAKVPEVDRAILGSAGDDLLVVVEKEKPDVVCLGYDQKTDEARLQKELIKRNVHAEVKRMKAHKPEQYKSTIIKRVIVQNEKRNS